ncbi:Histidine-containing phosphotransfer protein [Thalictrum thalictroides]|uniref:Histidine-containing phosphotransfer protein n=1 Tax=Thalictrum thalictroides TaxID=46969 RepID=A0A7J6UZA7_THATH|nr:Histidine-containing phosphotransfer protein [Thalictrum thalictroides]
MARKTGILVGGWKPIEDIKDPHVQELGKFAVSEHNKEAKTDLSFNEVVRGDTQVVSGLNYRLVVTAKDGSLKKNEYEAIVWEKAWLDSSWVTLSLIEKGFLDEFFSQVQRLQNEGNPGFVVHVFTLYFERAQKLLCEINSLLEQSTVDLKQVEYFLHELKGSSSSVGAHRVTEVCIAFCNLCKEQNLEECFRSMQMLTEEYSLLQHKVKVLFNWEQQILEAGGSIP